MLNRHGFLQYGRVNGRQFSHGSATVPVDNLILATASQAIVANVESFIRVRFL